MTHPLWQDDYWYLLLQLYLKRPIGMKPIYSRPMVELSIYLHIPPQALYQQMFQLRNQATPHMRQLVQRYADNPRALKKKADKVRLMRGFSNGDAFYNGVQTSETFERDFRPIDGCEPLTPVMLIMILDLYFRLTPITMVASTPEVAELAMLMRVSAQQIEDVMDVYQIIDPYLKRTEFMVTPLFKPCQQVWQRYGNDSPEALAATAAQLRDYFL